jgi:signal transduction histidine kinase
MGEPPEEEVPEAEPGSGRPPGPRRLADFLRKHRADILAEWEQAAKRIPKSRSLDRAAILDHIPSLLEDAQRAIEALAAGQEPAPTSKATEQHALARLDQGYDLDQVVDEYGLLQRCIFVRLVREGLAPEGFAELADLLSHSVARSVQRFHDAYSRTFRALDRIADEAFRDVGEIDDLIGRLLKVLAETTEAVDMAAVLLREDGHLVRRGAVGLDLRDEQDFTLQIGEGFAGTIAQRGEPLLVRNVMADPLVRSRAVRERGTRAIYGVPLIHNGQVAGVAHMGSRTAYDFSEDDKLLLRSLARRLAEVLVYQQAARTVRTRARQQTVLAKLGERALKERDLETVLQAASDAVAEGLEVEYVKVLEQLPGSETLLMRAGVGWQPGLVGRAVVEGGPDSQAAYAMRSDSAVAVDDLRTETRFRVVSGMSIVIRGRTAPFGVLGAHTRVRRHFNGVDVDFVRGVANVLAEAIERFRTDRDQELILGVIGHDLRSPLAAILTSAEHLGREQRSPETVARISQRIASSANRMERLIHQLLDFARARLGGGLPIERRRVDLEEVGAGIVAETRARFPDRDIRFETQGDTTGEWDPDRLGQILANILANAVQHAKAGTAVRVAVRDRGEGVELSVHNEGNAIPPHMIPRLFEPFFRGKRDDAGRESLGLGLYIVRATVVAHGGRIEVASNPGDGTTFRVTLPRFPASARESTRHP